MRGLAVLCPVSVLAACGSTPSGPPCDVRVDRMDVTLSVLSREHQVFYPAPGMKVLELPDGHRIERPALAFAVKADGEMLFEGQSYRDPLALRDAFGRVGPRYGSSFDRDAVYVVADPDLTLGALDEALTAVPYYLEPRLAGWGTQMELDTYQQRLRESASVKRFEAELEKKPPGEKAVYLAKTIEDAVGSDCGPLKAVFGGIAGVDEDKGAMMAREVPRALRECKCSLRDADLVEFAMYAVMGAFQRPQRWIALEREHGASMATVQNLVR